MSDREVVTNAVSHLDSCWLTIIGMGEDGPEALPPEARAALAAAEVIMAPPRHLGLIGETDARQISWPVPYADGLPLLMAERGRKTVVLASGDPFWFGAGKSVTTDLEPHEWRAIPSPSCFSLAANALGWAQEDCAILALHARPLETLRTHLAPTRKIIATLRDGEAVSALCAYLGEQGFGDTSIAALSALGGPNGEQVSFKASDPIPAGLHHPVCVALEIAGAGRVLPLTAGRATDWFNHDGQISKSPIRAMTLAALAPTYGAHLWDLGGGSGAVSMEWLLSDPSLRASCVEIDPARAARIAENGKKFGLKGLQVFEGSAQDHIKQLDRPDAVFIGGGLTAELLDDLRALLPAGVRIVANAVTIESEALLAQIVRDWGGSLMRVDLAHAAPLGSKQGWKAAYPIVQWSHET